MINKLKNTALAVITAATLIGSGQVWAFSTDSGPATNFRRDSFGLGCTMRVDSNRSNIGTHAELAIQTPLGRFHAGGSYFQQRGSGSNPSPTSATSITEAALQACGVSSIEPGSLTQDGAQGTYESDDEISFSFIGRLPGDSITYRYTYGIFSAGSTGPNIYSITRIPLGGNVSAIPSLSWVALLLMALAFSAFAKRRFS